MTQRVSAKQRAKIEAALERFDYSPNLFAMNQNRKRNKTIGILVPYLADPFLRDCTENYAAVLMRILACRF